MYLFALSLTAGLTTECSKTWKTLPYIRTRADVLVMLVVLPVLILLASLWVHRSVWLSRVLRCSWWRRVLDLRLWVGGALRGDDPRGGKELVNGGTQVGHLGGVQRPVVELSLLHALLQTWQTDGGGKEGPECSMSHTVRFHLSSFNVSTLSNVWLF